MGNAEPYLGDLEKTALLHQLFAVPRDQRDDAWQSRFLDHVADASFYAGDPQVTQGPDGFPYFGLYLPQPGQSFECFVLRHLIPGFLYEHGVGVVIHPDLAEPHWVFTLGDVICFQLYGQFYMPTGTDGWSNQISLGQGMDVLISQPSEEIFPIQIRKPMRQFLQGNHVTDVKILQLQQQTPTGLIRQIVFNLTSSRFESNEHFSYVMDRLSWFLPRHYTYGAIEESAFRSSFEPL